MGPTRGFAWFVASGSPLLVRHDVYGRDQQLGKKPSGEVGCIFGEAGEMEGLGPLLFVSGAPFIFRIAV